MAKLSFTFFIKTLISLSSLLITSIPNAYSKFDPEARNFKNACDGPQRSAMFQIYLFHYLSGPNMNTYDVARASIAPNPPSIFGRVKVADAPVLAGPDRNNSEEVGRAQGLVVGDDLKMFAYTEIGSILFTYGEYNGSTINVVGRNVFGQENGELSIVGGTGKFRCARGYIITNPISLEATSSAFSYEVYVTYARSTKS